MENLDEEPLSAIIPWLAVRLDLPCCITYSNTVGMEVETALVGGWGPSIIVLSFHCEVRFQWRWYECDGVLCLFPFSGAKVITLPNNLETSALPSFVLFIQPFHYHARIVFLSRRGSVATFVVGRRHGSIGDAF